MLITIKALDCSELTSEDVRKLVFKAVDLIVEVRDETRLPLCPNVEETGKRLEKGTFKAEKMPYERRMKSFYAFTYSYFCPPSTISIDSRRPFWDKPLVFPEIVDTALQYCAVHEVIHAYDFGQGNRIVAETARHIEKAHPDKLKTSIALLRRSQAPNFLRHGENLVKIWSEQYADMVTHYRTYIILSHKQLPKVDYIWSWLGSHYFPPNLLTSIECGKGQEYVLKRITDGIGEYCLVEALGEVDQILESNSKRYTV